MKKVKSVFIDAMCRTFFKTMFWGVVLWGTMYYSFWLIGGI